MKIKCHLSTLLGQRKLKVSDLERATGVNKNTLYRLYNETATRVDLDVICKVCVFLDITVGDLLEIVEE